jgi:3-hydroxyisobutyrate dehydrogenase
MPVHNDQRRPTIGFIGLGTMGAPMCGRIIDAGYEVWVYDRRQDRAEGLAARGGHRAQEMSEVGQRAQQVILMLPGNRDTAHAVDQLLPSVSPDTVIINMGTIDPSISVTLTAKVEAAGGSMVDAPAVKNRAAAEAGELGILVGGSPVVLERVRPLLSCVGGEVVHMGPSGSGLAMKLCHDLLVAQIQNGVNEMLVLARAYGLSFKETVRAIACGGGQNFYLDTRAEALRTGDFTPMSALQHMEKDLGLAARLCNRLGLRLPSLQHTRRLYRQAMEDGHSDRDVAAVIRVVEREASAAGPDGPELWEDEVTRTDMNVHNAPKA